MIITGHESPLIVGVPRNITCTWSGEMNVTKMEWFVTGLDALPVKSEMNSDSVIFSNVHLLTSPHFLSPLLLLASLLSHSLTYTYSLLSPFTLQIYISPPTHCYSWQDSRGLTHLNKCLTISEKVSETCRPQFCLHYC